MDLCDKELLKWLMITKPPLTQDSIAAVTSRLARDGWSDSVLTATFESYKELQGKPPGTQTLVDYPKPPQEMLERGFIELPNMGEGDKTNLLISMSSPKLWVFDNLVTLAEAYSLTQDAEPKLIRSNVVDNENGGTKQHAARTSSGVFYPKGSHPTISVIEERVSKLSQWPKENFESVHVLRYYPGEEYLPHNDYFDAKGADTSSILKRGGQRVASFIIFLNDVSVGGETIFPDVTLSVKAKRGNGVMFSYPEPTRASKTLHGGAPVISGVKWAAVVWMRQGEFK